MMMDEAVLPAATQKHADKRASTHVHKHTQPHNQSVEVLKDEKQS